MLAAHTERAVDLGREALRLTDELGLDEIRAKALINVGSALVIAGYREGLRDLERGIELAQQLNLIGEVIRGKNNTEVHLALAGDFTLARSLIAEVREIAQRYGYLSFVRVLDGASGIHHPYIMGEWDICLERANAFLRSVEAGSPHYFAANAYGRRGLIRLARGDDEAALLDTARALELARPVGDPQLLLPVLLDAARVYGETGDEESARALVEEVFARQRELPDLGWAVFYAHTIAWFGRLFGQESDVAALFDGETRKSRWLDSGRAVLAGDLSGAADIIADIDAPAFEAFYRLHAGTEQDVRAALEFYRGVGATRYVREGEAMLAATA
jgi:tetratricopeptide (TPR) repeat protein